MIDGTPVRLTPSGYGYGQQAQRVRQKRSRQLREANFHPHRDLIPSSRLPGTAHHRAPAAGSCGIRADEATGRLSMDRGPTYSLW
jgi:hypothetical protein